ncbi:MAG: hypothetical protein K0S60_658 [Evtepia sp.]|nr:hypothetical protein [Evtepia sp.]
MRFYPTQGSQAVIDRALSIRSGKAELLNVHIDVEPTGFSRGFYSIDIRYFYRITAEAFVGAARPVEICGLAIFDKRVILFGGEGSAKIFSSEAKFDDVDEQNVRRSNLPIAVVETVDPIVLNMKLLDPSDCCNPCCPPANCCDYPSNECYPGPGDRDLFDIPPCICSCFGSDLSFGNDRKRVYVTLGQFSIIRLERDTQLLIPVYDYCMPTKECAGTGGSTEDDPCEIFRQVKFPVDEFFPPSSVSGGENSHGSDCCRC